MIDRVLSFGPVPSRRLGISMGVNNIPGRSSSYSCVYCQAGRTMRMSIDRAVFQEPETLLEDVAARLKASDPGAVDYITLVPDGEPTLDSMLGREIEVLRSLGLPVAVITNSSLVGRDDVREDLGKADWVSLKIDTVDGSAWKRLNRPHARLDLGEIMGGIRRFAASFGGTLVTETMLVAGFNDTVEGIERTAEFVGTIGPSTAYLSIPIRPPAEPGVAPPPQEVIDLAYDAYSKRVGRVQLLVDFEGNDFECTGDAGDAIIGITLVHPIRTDAMETLLTRAGAGWDLVRDLLEREALETRTYGGATFYIAGPATRSSQRGARKGEPGPGL